MLMMSYNQPIMCTARPGMPCDFVEKNAEEVCKYCGRVGRRILFTGQAKIFEPGDEKQKTADGGKSLGLPTTKMSGSVYTSNTSILNPGFKARDRTIVGIEKQKPKDVAIERNRHLLQDKCVQMQLSKKTQEECLDLFDKCVEKGPIPRNQVNTYILGILFHGCKKGGSDITVRELARQTKQDEKTVRKGMKHVEKRCSVSDDKVKVESSGLIERYCITLGMDSSFCYKFVSNAKEVDRRIRQFLEGKKPNTVAATDIVLTLRWFYPEIETWTFNRIAEVAGLKPPTLRKSIAEVEAEMSKARCTAEDIVNYARSLSGDHPHDG